MNFLKTTLLTVLVTIAATQTAQATLKYDTTSGKYYSSGAWFYNRESYDKICRHCFTIAQQTINFAIARKAGTSNKEIRTAVKKAINVYLTQVVYDDFLYTARTLNRDLAEYYDQMFA